MLVAAHEVGIGQVLTKGEHGYKSGSGRSRVHVHGEAGIVEASVGERVDVCLRGVRHARDLRVHMTICVTSRRAVLGLYAGAVRLAARDDPEAVLRREPGVFDHVHRVHAGSEHQVGHRLEPEAGRRLRASRCHVQRRDAGPHTTMRTPDRQDCYRERGSSVLRGPLEPGVGHAGYLHPHAARPRAGRDGHILEDRIVADLARVLGGRRPIRAARGIHPLPNRALVECAAAKGESRPGHGRVGGERRGRHVRQADERVRAESQLNGRLLVLRRAAGCLDHLALQVGPEEVGRDDLVRRVGQVSPVEFRASRVPLIVVRLPYPSLGPRARYLDHRGGVRQVPRVLGGGGRQPCAVFEHLLDHALGRPIGEADGVAGRCNQLGDGSSGGHLVDGRLRLVDAADVEVLRRPATRDRGLRHRP